MQEKQNAYDILKERGFIEQSTDEKALRELFGKKKVIFYSGFDPSGPNLHVGHLELLMAMIQISFHGHQPIALVGGGTGLVGDPSDKDKTRPLNTLAKIKENVASIKKEIESILKTSGREVIVVNNGDWLKELNYLEFLRDFGVHFSVNRLLTIEWIKNRLKTGLSFLEFNYQLLQAYDFWHLFKKYGCEVQLEGKDQWSNIIAGIELIRRIEDKEVYGITIPLLTTASGKKMGKTESGAVFLSPQLTSAYEYYQFWINTEDKDVKKFLALFTLLPMDEVKKLGSLKGEKIKQAKEVLAYEATKIVHGEEDARKAMDASQAIFEKGNRDSGAMPTTLIKKEELSGGIPVFKLFLIAKLCKSGGEATRLIKQGGARLNNEKIENFETLITEKQSKNGTITLQVGKKKFHKLKIV
ncbi:MAG: tyrosine--tRNA ligase [Candidatus Wolfebacteria bacterium]|nr:tyrosine--tRNA ligase [Candidatus Wolfebacteria bacterium]